MGRHISHHHEIDSSVNAVTIQNALQYRDTQSAAQTMMADVVEARQTGDSHYYESNLARQLDKKGLMPDLALGWAKNNFDTISDTDGRISLVGVKRMEALTVGDPLINGLLKALEQDLPKMERQAGTSGKGIALGDFDKIFRARQLESEQKFNDNINSIPEISSLRQLFANNKKLAHALVEMHVEGTGTGVLQHLKGYMDAFTGTFDQQTLKAFESRQKQDPEFAKQWSAADVAAVSDLAKNWNDPKLQPLRDMGINRMGTQSIESGLGLNKIRGYYDRTAFQKGEDVFANHKLKLEGID
jgi:hypothetical protein